MVDSVRMTASFYKFEVKFSQGADEQSLSRDIYRLVLHH